MSSSSDRVDTSIQVKYGFVEARSIVGQEDNATERLSTNLANMSLRKQSKGIRPPLVGQASSSSNDSVSLSIETRTPLDVPMSSPTQSNIDQNKIFVNDTSENVRTSHFLNRSDYINQKPPEGSYFHISTSLPPAESCDFTRVRSSSSASSVTSSRPLEWDNGADVGYSQCFVIGGKIMDPNMSTVERMALVSSTKLLRRSDPEGTTGGTYQQVGLQPTNSNDPKIKITNKFCPPNAESTPLGTCVASDASPDPIDFISPIPYEKRENSVSEISSSESESTSHKLSRSNPLQNSENQCDVSNVRLNSKQKIPLFPELNLSLGNPNTNVIGEANVNRHVHCRGEKDVTGGRLGNNESEMCITNRKEQFMHELKSKLESIGLECSEVVHKKLSSSLENISNVSNAAPSCEKIIPSTLPRSQSQTNLNLEKLVHEHANESKISKSNILIQNLFKNKSASSSSVATVVQRKGDSPKHALVQTSILKKQSVGTQVCDSIDRNTVKSKVFTGTGFAFDETPHLPKANLSQHLMPKSNYFDCSNGDFKEDNHAIDHLITNFNRTNHIGDEIKQNANNFGTHFHSGILCRGAHRKKLLTEGQTGHKMLHYINFQNVSSFGPECNFPTPHSSNNQVKNPVSSTNFNPPKNMSGGVFDSVESSAKSGGFGTDKQYSVTVEDRVNSFEYLPGHVYENNERQQPINSCGTSSMSIENQTSNNDTPEDQNKIWESSGGSMSSTFERDADRGVNILSDFAKGTYEDDTLLKKKLIRRVIHKLILKNQLSINKKVECYQDLMKNTPWVPPRPSNPIERNNDTTTKSKVPCEFSTHSEKSGTTNTSSECFIPRPADTKKNFPYFRDESCKKFQGEFSSTSNVTPEQYPNQKERSSRALKIDTFKNKKKQTIEESGNLSAKGSRNIDWKEPATKTEKLIEERRKAQNESSGSYGSVSQLLDMERENQLFWIRSEIEHLSNLKQLLERQEELKRGLKNVKSKRSVSSERNVLKDKNRNEKDKIQPGTSATSNILNKKSSLKTKGSYPPKLSEWLKDSTAKLKSQDKDLDGWASHHYEKNENIKSCMKRRSKQQPRQNRTRISSASVDENCVIYDEPLSSPQRKKHDLNKQKHVTSSSMANHRSESASSDIKDCNRIDVSGRVAQPTPATGPRQECHCLCQRKCQCCNKSAETSEKKKKPLGYYIIFDDPKKNDDTKMGELKRKPSRLRAGTDVVIEKEEVGLGKGENNVRSSQPVLSSNAEPASSGSENDMTEPNQENKKPIFKGGAGELQYHLLHNRPTYVSRAEDRRQCIAQMQYLRELSSQNKQRLLSLTQPLPPQHPPTKIQRVFSQHKMRQMTERKYRQLSEVKEKLQDTKKKESYRTNRLMAEIFKKNLQKRVLKGEVNLSNSVFVISSI